MPFSPRSILTRLRNHDIGRGAAVGQLLEVSRHGSVVRFSGQLSDPQITVERLIVRQRDTPREQSIVNTAASGFDFELDLNDLTLWSGNSECLLDLHLAVHRPQWGLPPDGAQTDPERDVWRLGNFAETERSESFGSVRIGELEASAVVTRAGNWSIRITTRPKHDVRTSTSRMTTKKSAITFTGHATTGNQRVEDIALTAVGRNTGEVVELDLHWEPDEALTRTSHGIPSYTFHGSVPFEALAPGGNSCDDVIDVLLEFGFHDDAPALRRGIIVPGPVQSFGLGEGHSIGPERATTFVPYKTAKTRQLGLRLERHSSADLRYLRRLLWLAPLFFLIRPFLGIWLIGEQPAKAQDNGYHFFRWVRENHPRKRAYYVIDADAGARARLEPLGNVVSHSSRQHIRYSLLASRLVGTHHAEFLLASRTPRALRWSRGVRVFLQHGVMGTKNMANLYGRKAPGFRTDRFLVSSEFEAEMIRSDFEFGPSQIHVTGLSRFDRLFNSDISPDAAPERSIVVIPTWRDWLMHEERFLASDYFTRWQTFINHPDLRALISAHGLTVKFILHPNMSRYSHFFEGSGITVLRQDEVDVQNLLMSSAALVTDYSSVGFDFSFLHRPVFYFQFDRSKFLGRYASHLDLDAQLPGRICDNEATLIAQLTESVENHLVVDPDIAARSRRFLTHRDRNNNQRVYDAVRRGPGWHVPLNRIRNSAVGQRTYARFRRSRAYFRSMRLLFGVARLLPRSNVAVFESGLGVQYGDSPRYIYEQLIGRDTGIRTAWINNTTVRLPDPSSQKVRRLTPRYFWLLGRAKYWINNQNFPHYLKPARRTRYLQTWHGTPLKKMQHDVENVTGQPEGYIDRVTRMTGFWDGLISPSPYATAAFRSAFRYSGTMYETGYPRNDLFHSGDMAQRTALVRNRLQISDDRKIILYAPTFRDDTKRGNRFVTELMLDLRDMHQRLGDEFILVLRFHNIVKNRITIPEEMEGFVIDASNYPDAQELLLATDVLITDYSSIMFDFAALRRPLLFFTYDIEHYRDNLRGFYLDFEAVAPGPLLQTSAEVVDALLDLEGVRGSYADKLEAFASTYGPLDDGHASDRVVDQFFDL